MQADWLDLINWKRVLIGVLIGVLTPVFFALILQAVRLGQAWALLLIFTELSVLIGSGYASLSAAGRHGRLVNALLVALICAIVSLTASVSLDPQAGANLPGISLLLLSYGLMGILGGFGAELKQYHR